MNVVVQGSLVKLLLSLWLLVAFGEALAQRNVIVNDERLTPLEISQLETLVCTSIPDGEYWIDLHSGAWGYASSYRRVGYVGEACQRRKSLSERRKLYRPGEILSE